jgi:hypothetical protein
MSAPPSASRAAERWFLDRGLPWVLPWRALLDAVWSRSTPALAGGAIVAMCMVAVYFLTGRTRIDIEGQPTPVEWVVLAIVMLAAPVACAVGWITRMGSPRTRAVVSTAAVAVGVGAALIVGRASTVIATAVVVAAVLALTASGIGSVMGWEMRLALSQLAAAGGLVIRALPVVLLTILVFFNGQVWLMAATISRARQWVAVCAMVAVAAVFVFAGTLDRARPLLRSATAHPDLADRLAGTPFEEMTDPAQVDPLGWAERVNVVFVLVAAQLAQIWMVSVVAAAIFFGFGLLLVSPELLAAWTRGGSPQGTLLWMTIPVPQALIQITWFLGALTFMYVSARSVGDGEYRSRFLDPLIEELELRLVARNRYRHDQRGRP